ncbi:MAG: TRAM domain-containing protein [Acidobacteriota bacterium]
MMAVGDTLALTIEKPAAGGRMLARANGLVVLVSGAIPGERVQAVVERMGKGVAYAATTRVDESSPDRRPGASDSLCGGCLYAHVAYPRQLELKSLVVSDAFTRIGRMPLPTAVPVTPSGEQGYRMRARLHLRAGRAGFFREGTHDLCDPRATGQLLPETCDVLEGLAAGLAAGGLDGVQAIDLTENCDASQRVVGLEGLFPPGGRGRGLERLAALDGLTGLWSPSAEYGEVHVTDVLHLDARVSIALRRHVLAFFQGNRHLLERLVVHVAAQVPEAADLLDLYAGVGLFALAAAAARRARVVAVEGDPVAARDLAANAVPTDGAVAAVHQSVEDFVRVGPRAGVGGGERGRAGRFAVIVDPPRTGLSRPALDGVVRLGAPRIVYVSCDVATLARDARRFVDAGYGLTRVDAFDLFPNTPHVETVAVLDRRG